jgi:hypothetical protein
MITSLEKARRWLAKAGGITSIERPQADFGQRVEDPRLSAYLDQVGGPCSMEVLAGQGLSFNAFTLGPKSRHPWYLAAQAFAEGADERARLMLEKYYELVRPASLVEWHDLAPEDCPGLAGWPRHAWSIMPWKPADPGEAIRKAEAAQREENRKHGLDAGMEVGSKAFGPVSEAKLEIELKRIAELAKSISLNGFRYDAQDIDLGGRFLVADGCWRWLPTAGMHRIPVASALGIREFTLRVVSVVRRDESSLWPQVKSGLFTEQGALQLFDRLFEGRAPKCASAWVDWVDHHVAHED